MIKKILKSSLEELFYYRQSLKFIRKSNFQLKFYAKSKRDTQEVGKFSYIFMRKTLQRCDAVKRFVFVREIWNFAFTMLMLLVTEDDVEVVADDVKRLTG